MHYLAFAMAEAFDSSREGAAAEREQRRVDSEGELECSGGLPLFLRLHCPIETKFKRKNLREKEERKYIVVEIMA
jgi:hypothetical protein